MHGWRSDARNGMLRSALRGIVLMVLFALLITSLVQLKHVFFFSFF